MRFLGALVLLLQFQPLAASALCFHNAEIAEAECPMPAHERPADRTLAPVGAAVPTDCANAAYCTRTAPAVLKLAQYLQITPVIHSASALMDVPLAAGEPLAPPFHPPKT